MVDALRGDKNVHHVQQGVDAACQAGADDGVGVVLLNEAHGAHGGIHLADTTSPKDNLVVSKAAKVAAESIAHLAILNVHSYNNSYFHIFPKVYFAKILKNVRFLYPMGKYFF